MLVWINGVCCEVVSLYVNYLCTEKIHLYKLKWIKFVVQWGGFSG